MHSAKVGKVIGTALAAVFVAALIFAGSGVFAQAGRRIANPRG